MSRKKLWLITILVLSISLLSSQAFAQETQDDPFEIWPVFNGSEDIYVPEGENIVIRTSFRYCSKQLSRIWTMVDRVTLSLDDQGLVTTPKESWRHWGKPFPVPNDEGVPCANESNTLWVVNWEYELGELALGNYPVHFTENVRKPFTDGADYDGNGLPDFFDWDVTVNFNIIVGGVSGSISGFVTEQDTGFAIEGLEVSACEFENDEPCWSAWTEGDGSYTISGIPTGDYRLATGGQDGWAIEFYYEKPEYFGGDPVSLGPGENLYDYNFTLEPGGSISGFVTEQDTGFAIEGLEVSACEFENDEPCWCAWTEGDGSYTISGIPTGDYRLATGGQDGWAIEFDYEKPEYFGGDPVSLGPGENLYDYNFTLELAE